MLGCAHPTTSLIEKNLRRTLADYTVQLYAVEVYGQGGPPNFTAPIFTAQEIDAARAKWGGSRRRRRAQEAAVARDHRAGPAKNYYVESVITGGEGKLA